MCVGERGRACEGEHLVAERGAGEALTVKTSVGLTADAKEPVEHSAVTRGAKHDATRMRLLQFVFFASTLLHLLGNPRGRAQDATRSWTVYRHHPSGSRQS